MVEESGLLNRQSVGNCRARVRIPAPPSDPVRMKVGFTYNAAGDYPLQPGDPPDRYAEFDKEDTLKEIAGALAEGGHEIIRIGDGRRLAERLTAGERWDIVFNIAEGLWGRNRESQVPALCELYDQPYTGSDGLTLALTLDKVAAKKYVLWHKVATPGFAVVEEPGDLKSVRVKFPAIVKLSLEGTSKGLSAASVVHNRAELTHQAEALLAAYQQPLLIEEFVRGTEFTVAVVGDDPPETLPTVQVTILGKTDLGEEIYTHDRVESSEVQYVCPARIPARMNRAIQSLAFNAYRALGCRDVGRIDIRVSARGTPYFLECNPLPNLGRIDVFPLVANAMGLTYNRLILKILNAGIRRYPSLSSRTQ